jgi:hypothetical protein
LGDIYTYSVRLTNPSNPAEVFHYYGVRYANGAKFSDLGTTYFTSSRAVHAVLAKWGIACAQWKLRRKIFSSKLEALAWEAKILTRLGAVSRKDFLNLHSYGRD